MTNTQGSGAPPPPPSWDAQPSSGALAPRGYGGFWIRVVAYIIDAVVLGVASSILFSVLGVSLVVMVLTIVTSVMGGFGYEIRRMIVETEGEVTIRQLVINALRMRPDRIVVGEARGGEALDMLQAMNTGHDGCMSTVHANSPRDALLRLEMLAGFSGFQGQDATLKSMIATALDLVIQVGRLSDGRRRILAISEVLGVQDGRIVTNELFVYQPERKVFEATGLSPANPKLRLRDDEQAMKFHRSW